MKKQSQIESVIANKVKQSLKMKLKLNRLLRHSSLIPRNDKLKKIFLLFSVLFSILSFSQDKINFKEYSYAEFFNMIEKEKDSVFKLSDAIIKFDAVKDQDFAVITNIESQNRVKLRKDTITIQKELQLENIYFLSIIVDEAFLKMFDKKNSDSGDRKFKGGELYNMKFEKKVSLKNCNTSFLGAVFHEEVQVRYDSIMTQVNDYTEKYRIFNSLIFEESIFKRGINVVVRPNSTPENENLDLSLSIRNCEFWPGPKSNEDYFRNNSFILQQLSSFELTNSTFHGNGDLWIYSEGNRSISIHSNDFKKTSFEARLAMSKAIKNLTFENNSINQPTFLQIEHLDRQNIIDWKQFKKGVYPYGILRDYVEKRYNKTGQVNSEMIRQDSIKDEITEGVYRYRSIYKEQNKYLERFRSHYVSQHDKEYENAVFMDIKNLETNRLRYLYAQDPTFKTFFKWRINQFLKVFSSYGTEPERAVIVSMYVILLFAFIYLLFPNSWDKHGRKRIMNRYAFFFTYMNKKSGIHEVYLDHQQEDLLEFDEFKTLVEQQGKTVPKFFTATALPLYKWAISGTKISASFLSKIDIMKGTWSDLPQSKRIWKSILLVGAFLIAIIYDIAIKMLNALMLSINTFTTLGFGEIPIKGLPRYLAIIQGFIGWFMLTIFSVSLISQLLN